MRLDLPLFGVLLVDSFTLSSRPGHIESINLKNHFHCHHLYFWIDFDDGIRLSENLDFKKEKG